MPHTNVPIWDPVRFSKIKNPVYLRDGTGWHPVDESVITYRADGGREIFAERLAPIRVRTNPVKRMVRRADGTEIEKMTYTLISMKAARRLNQPDAVCGGGESARLTPGRPTSGNIDLRGYGLLLDAFVGGTKRAVGLFRARKTPRHKGGVPREVQMRTHDGSVLYFPWEGMTAKVRDSYRRKPVIAPAATISDADPGPVSDNR